MTDEQINCAIATECGWTVELSHMQSGIDVIRNGKRKPLPDYCNDLNSMYEAEGTLFNDNQKLCWKYVSKLHIAADPIGCGNYAGAHATARQRAEAFLRTLGKWEDGK